MKIAAIDIGSNSFHMVIVEVNASGGFEVIAREKEMVRLGAGTLSRGRLSATAMRRGLAALSRFKRQAEANDVDQVLAVATSAIREARNGEDFLDAIGTQVGIWPRAISGQDEARLIYLAAIHSVHLEGRRALVLDIGGGSVELAVGEGRRLDWAGSEKIGVLRMAERFAKSDPLDRDDEEAIVEAVEKVLGPHRDHVRSGEPLVAVGTSGTILALGTLALQARGALPDSLQHVTLPAEALREVRRRLVGSSLRQRLRMPGLDERRADIIVAGAVILDTLLSRLGISELTLCDWALREGLLLDYIQEHPRYLALAESQPDVRRRSVLELAARCDYDAAHAEQVAALSLQLFDALIERHGLTGRERDLLEYAALLHDIGHHIAYLGHHRHAYYLIKNAVLRGFQPLEIELMANVARYHRRGLPSRKQSAFAALAKPERRLVRTLAGILRLADVLDRSHRQVVRGVSVTLRGDTLRVRVEAVGDCELELWGASRRADLLERALKVGVKVEVRTLPGRVRAFPRRARGR